MKFSIMVSCTLASSAVALVARESPQAAPSTLKPADAVYGSCSNPEIEPSPFGVNDTVVSCKFELKNAGDEILLTYGNPGGLEALTSIDPRSARQLVIDASRWGHEQQRLNHASDDEQIPITNATSALDPKNDSHRAGLTFRSGSAKISFAYLPCDAKGYWDENWKIPTYGLYQQYLQNLYTMYDAVVVRGSHREICSGEGRISDPDPYTANTYIWYRISNVQDGPYDMSTRADQCPNEKPANDPPATLPTGAA